MSFPFASSPSFQKGERSVAGRRRVVTATLVAGAHVAVLLLVWQLKLVEPRDSEAPRVIEIRLLPERVERRSVARAASAREARARQAVSVVEPVRGIVLPLPQLLPVPEVAIAPPPETMTTAPAGQVLPGPGGGRVGLDGGAVAGSGLAASGVRGLALTPDRKVLRGALENPAVNDPRSNTPKPNLEERMAMALDPGLCLKLERTPEGQIRRVLKRSVEAQSTMSAVHGQRTAPVRVCP